MLVPLRRRVLLLIGSTYEIEDPVGLQLKLAKQKLGRSCRAVASHLQAKAHNLGLRSENSICGNVSFRCKCATSEMTLPGHRKALSTKVSLCKVLRAQRQAF